MKPPFDIAADLDTPVSAYLKLKPFQAALPAGERRGRRAPRALFVHRLRRLRSRSASTSAASRSTVARRPAPATQQRTARRAARCARAQRRSRARKFPVCRCSADWSASPATTSCDTSSACRRARSVVEPTPEAHYLAPHSLLVFDHLTRGVALLHAGSESERIALRKEVVQALRGGIPAERQAHPLFAGRSAV